MDDHVVICFFGSCPSSAAAFSPIEQVKKVRVPILFVHGTKDQLVPVSMAQELLDACAGKKKLLIIENAGHAESIAAEPDRYQQAIRSFFGI